MIAFFNTSNPAAPSRGCLATATAELGYNHFAHHWINVS